MAGGQPPPPEWRAVPDHHGGGPPSPDLSPVEGLLAAAEDSVMRFRFGLVGSPQSPVMEVDVADLDELHDLMWRGRFVRGRLAPEYCEGESCGALIATSRITMVMEVD